MTRLSGPIQTETQSQVVTPAWLVSLGVTGGSGTYDLCAYDADITWGGKTYTHTSFTIQPLDERQDGSITTIQAAFSLDEQDFLTVLQTRANYVWKPMTITLVLIDDTGTPLTDAVYAWKGYMTTRNIAQGDREAQIQIVGQDWMCRLGETGRIRFDDASQEGRASGDTFFKDMPGLQGQHITWIGKKIPTTGGVISGTGKPFGPP